MNLEILLKLDDLVYRSEANDFVVLKSAIFRKGDITSPSHIQHKISMTITVCVAHRQGLHAGLITARAAIEEQGLAMITVNDSTWLINC